MEVITLNAVKRDSARGNADKLRKEGEIPGVVYGRGLENRNVSVKYNDFVKVFERAGESTLVDLVIGTDEPVKVLVHDTQTDALTDRYTHVDFRQVNMKEKVDAEVQIVFEGVSPAVKEQGAVLVQQIDSVHIKALPGDLMHEIVIDLSKLSNVGDKIYVRDLELPEGVEILNDLSVVIAGVEAQRTAEEVESASSEDAEAIIEERKSEGDKADDGGGNDDAKDDKKE